MNHWIVTVIIMLGSGMSTIYCADSNNLVKTTKNDSTTLTTTPSSTGILTLLLNFFSSTQAAQPLINAVGGAIVQTNNANALTTTDKPFIQEIVLPVANTAWFTHQQYVNPSGNSLFYSFLSYAQKHIAPLDYLENFCQTSGKLVSAALLDKIRGDITYAKLAHLSNNASENDISIALEAFEKPSNKAILKKIFDRMWITNGLLIDALATNDLNTIACIKNNHMGYVIPALKDEIAIHASLTQRTALHKGFWGEVASTSNDIVTDFSSLSKPHDSKNPLIAFDLHKTNNDRFNDLSYYTAMLATIKQGMKCHATLNKVLNDGNCHRALKLMRGGTDEKYIRNLVMPDVVETVDLFRQLNVKYLKFTGDE